MSKCRTMKAGGGVGLYIDSFFNYRIIDKLTMSTEYIECIFVEIVQNNESNRLIGSMYRPPNSDIVKFNQEIEQIFNHIDKSKYKLTIGPTCWRL